MLFLFLFVSRTRCLLGLHHWFSGSTLPWGFILCCPAMGSSILLHSLLPCNQFCFIVCCPALGSSISNYCGSLPASSLDASLFDLSLLLWSASLKF
ncbi:hypothetical protein CISIN_1g041411mg [Citrus sinensis]|uniref:Secreted protein n=1 Tax=Citrus sinensis TaxID=2711 RepID=A0A067FIV4_CITSI|nr:hypothetical protein CISIN_1g041411mg [Citrus sinensis]